MTQITLTPQRETTRRAFKQFLPAHAPLARRATLRIALCIALCASLLYVALLYTTLPRTTLPRTTLVAEPRNLLVQIAHAQEEPIAPESTTPESDAPESDLSEGDAPETTTRESDAPESVDEIPLEEEAVIQLFPADDLLNDEPQDSTQNTEAQNTETQNTETQSTETQNTETEIRQDFLPPVALTEEAISDLPLAALSVLDETTGVLPTSLWSNSPAARLNALFNSAEARTDSAAAADLWRRILLSPFPLDATAPNTLAIPITALDPANTTEETTAELEANQTTNQNANQSANSEQIRSLKWFVWRTEQLQQLGRWRDLHSLFALVPRSRLRFNENTTGAGDSTDTSTDNDSNDNAGSDASNSAQAATLAELSRLRVATMILLGERAIACEEAQRVLQQNTNARISSIAAVRTTETWFQRLSVACKIAEGEPDVALLGLDLLRETDFVLEGESPETSQARNDFFALAAARLGYGKLPEAPSFSALNLFLADGLRGADLLALFSENETLSPRALTGLAHSQNLATPLRIGLAERAVEIGAMDSTDLKAFYRSVSFPPADEDESDPIAQAATLTGASQRAFIWQVSEPLRRQLRQAQGLPAEDKPEQNAEDSLTLEAIVAETAPEQTPDREAIENSALTLADLLRLYAESARGEGLTETAAFLWHDTAELLPAARFLADHAEWIALVLLRSGDAQAASPWLELLSQAQDSQAERALYSLWVEARLAGISVAQLGGIDFTAWQGRELISFGEAASEQVLAARQELHLRFLLDGLGLRAANEDWFALAQSLSQSADPADGLTGLGESQNAPQTNSASTGATTRALQDLVLAEHSFGESIAEPLHPTARVALLEALDDASFGGRDGEALLLALRLHGQAVAVRASPSLEGEAEINSALNQARISQALELERAVVQGLRRADFASEARGLALEFWRAR